MVSRSKFVGMLIILILPNGHNLLQAPQPIHKYSDSVAILDVLVTSIHNLPIFTTGHDFLHSIAHLLGLHLSGLIIAIRVVISTFLGEKC
jgi:hypothetical protein